MGERLSVLLLALALSGCRACGPSATATTTETESTSGGESGETEAAPVAVAHLSPGLDVRPLPLLCDRNVREMCNALDDDCSGGIDEGCGYATGKLQITAAWTTGVDLDLYVTIPSGDLVSYQRPTSYDGAVVDRSSRGNCERTPDPANVENFVYPGRPPSGHYVVELHYWGECMSSAGSTDVTVGLSAGGRQVGAYRVTIGPNERRAVLEFDVE
ncbi:MAG: hypothetical protein U0230_11495 [Polyangiales bacterium]